MMTVMLSAAGSLRWFRDALAPGEDFGDLVAAAGGGAAPGATACCSSPTSPGERSPHPDPLARGAFVGLTVSHDRRHLTRAVLEGVAFGLRDGLDLMIAAGMPRADPDPRFRRRRGQPALAPDPGGRPRRRDRNGRHDGGRGVRCRPAGRRGSRLVSIVAAATAATVTRHAGGVARSGVERYAQAHARYRELYPALAPNLRSRLTDRVAAPARAAPADAARSRATR